MFIYPKDVAGEVERKRKTKPKPSWKQRPLSQWKAFSELYLCILILWPIFPPHLRVQKSQLQLKQGCAWFSSLEQCLLSGGVGGRATDHSQYCAGQDYNLLSKSAPRQIISQGFSYYMQKINNQKWWTLSKRLQAHLTIQEWTQSLS